MSVLRCPVLLGADSTREELYTDVRLNETLCARYQAHMQTYDRAVRKDYDKVLTGSSDIGPSCTGSKP